MSGILARLAVLRGRRNEVNTKAQRPLDPLLAQLAADVGAPTRGTWDADYAHRLRKINAYDGSDSGSEEDVVVLPPPQRKLDPIAQRETWRKQMRSQALALSRSWRGSQDECLDDSNDSDVDPFDEEENIIEDESDQEKEDGIDNLENNVEDPLFDKNIPEKGGVLEDHNCESICEQEDRPAERKRCYDLSKPTIEEVKTGGSMDHTTSDIEEDDCSVGVSRSQAENWNNLTTLEDDLTCTAGASKNMEHNCDNGGLKVRFEVKKVAVSKSNENPNLNDILCNADCKVHQDHATCKLECPVGEASSNSISSKNCNILHSDDAGLDHLPGHVPSGNCSIDEKLLIFKSHGELLVDDEAEEDGHNAHVRQGVNLDELYYESSSDNSADEFTCDTVQEDDGIEMEVAAFHRKWQTENDNALVETIRNGTFLTSKSPLSQQKHGVAMDSPATESDMLTSLANSSNKRSEKEKFVPDKLRMVSGRGIVNPVLTEAYVQEM